MNILNLKSMINITLLGLSSASCSFASTKDAQEAAAVEKNFRVLQECLQDKPGNRHRPFYLANCHRLLKNNEEALKWYEQCLSKESLREEFWYSQLMIAEILEEKGLWDQAVQWYLDAFDTSPDRAEPLKKIAEHYRNAQEWNSAYLFAKKGAQIPRPSQDALFIDHSVYDYGMDEELSISAYYTPQRAEGYEAANRLLFNRKYPNNNSNHKNLLYYVENLKTVKSMPICFELPPIREGFPDLYHPMNPCIQKTKEGYLVLCRTVNFSQEGGKGYKSRNPDDPTIRTKNFLLKYDPSFNLISQREIVENLSRKKARKVTSIVGLEDCRLFNYKGNLWVFSTTYDTHPFATAQSLCKIQNQQVSSGSLQVEKLIPLKGPDPKRCEKNWLPFILKDELHAIYGYDPLTIMKINPDTGECKIVKSEVQEHDFSFFRGSAPPIAFDGGSLILVHEVAFGKQRYYLHRFVYLDQDLNITKVSKPFTFFQQGIEYCCGMAIDHEGKNCILSVGIDDKEAHLLFVDLNEVRSLLEQQFR
jgi:tetratricopeptide (TPR) repeat protein